MNEVLMRLALAEGSTLLEGAQLFPIGKWRHPRGEINITAERAQKFVDQFNARAAGQDLPVLFIHSDKGNVSNPKYGEAAGWIKNMRADKERGVLIDIDFTDEGAKAVRDRKYRYLSAEYFDQVQLPHHAAPQRDVVVGAALVNRPHLKGMNPILNEETGHLFLTAEVNGKPDDSGGGGPVDPILLALAKSAGLELSEDVTELTDEQRSAITKHLEAQASKVTETQGQIKTLQQELQTFKEKDPETKAKSLAEAGFGEEARLLAEYRGDRAVMALEESTAKGFALTAGVKTKVREYGVTGDVTHLNEAIAIMAAGKGLVDQRELGTSLGNDDDPVSSEAGGGKLVALAEAKVKELDIEFSEAMTLVASENPGIWNEYQNAMGSSKASHLEVAS